MPAVGCGQSGADRLGPQSGGQWKRSPLRDHNRRGLAGTTSTVRAFTRLGGLFPDAPSSSRNVLYVLENRHVAELTLTSVVSKNCALGLWCPHWCPTKQCPTKNLPFWMLRLWYAWNPTEIRVAC